MVAQVQHCNRQTSQQLMDKSLPNLQAAFLLLVPRKQRRDVPLLARPQRLLVWRGRLRHQQQVEPWQLGQAVNRTSLRGVPALFLCMGSP